MKSFSLFMFIKIEMKICHSISLFHLNFTLLSQFSDIKVSHKNHVSNISHSPNLFIYVLWLCTRLCKDCFESKDKFQKIRKIVKKRIAMIMFYLVFILSYSLNNGFAMQYFDDLPRNNITASNRKSFPTLKTWSTTNCFPTNFYIRFNKY